MSATAASRPIERAPLIEFGPFVFDPTSRILRRGDVELALPPRALGVLEVLLERAGDVVPRQTLIDLVWKEAFVTDTSLAEAVSVLRQTLGDDSQSPAYIQTVHRRGYRFVSPVARRGPQTAADSGRIDERDRAQPATTVSPSIVWQLVPWSAAVICALVASAAVWRLVRTPRLNVPAVRFAVTPEIGTTFDTSAPAVAISSDGTRVAWSACDDRSCRLYVRPLSSVDAERVPGTDGARMPFFSPDGRWLGFFADGRLKKVATDGGAAVSLADAPEPLGGTWVDHEIVFAASAFSGLIAVPASGGEPRSITVPLQASGEVRHAWPFVVPGSDLLGFTIQRTVTRLSTGDLGVLSRISGPASAWRTLLAGVGTARAGAPDVFVFSRDDDLQAVLFDPVRMAIAGEPRTVASGAGSRQGGPHVALSADGSVVLATGAPADAASLLWWSPDASSAVGGERPRLGDASLSPDGRRIAGVSNTAGRDDLWIAELDRGAAIRVTHAGVNTAPVWSADGRTLYFASRTNGVFEIWSRRLDESAQGARVYGGGRHSIPAAVSPDGRTLAFIRPEETTRADIWLLPLDGAPAGPLVAGPFDEIAPAFSPRADLLAYQSAESGRWEVYVRRIGADHRALVSTDGGTRPFWSPDGSAIYFQSGNRLMRSTIESSASGLTAGAVASVASLAGSSVVGMARDGRLLLERPARPPASAIVALGWIRDVRQLLGPPATVMPR